MSAGTDENTAPEARSAAPAARPALSSEQAEWVEELAASWVEVYKKAATTHAILRLVTEAGPIPAHDLTVLLHERTGWTFTERGLYRTLKRLAGAEVLAIERVAVPRTGAARQDFSITPVGAAYLARIEEETLGRRL